MQTVQEPASSLHWKVEPGSVEVNWNVPLAEVESSAGVEVIDVSGGVVSMITHE